jgi:signal transduction histidine kinase
MQRSGERLLTLVTDILDFSKMEAGRARAQQDLIDLRTVLQRVVASFATIAESQGLDLEITVDPDVPAVLLGDEARIAKLVTNLLDNALKFTEDGWIRASVSVRKARPTSIDLLLVVADSGIGMTLEQQGRLFHSFSQADASITRKYAGTGLGLPVCKQLVTLMRGSISVQSTLEEGSRFSVVLPLGRSQG